MPIRVERIRWRELRARVAELESAGYVCKSEDDNWYCVKPINEIQLDIRVIVVTERA